MAERYIPEHRRTQFKAKSSFKPDELRRRREEQQVEIRKQKRDENLAKRRGIQTSDGQIGVGGAAGMAAASDSEEEGGAETEVCICILFFWGWNWGQIPHVFLQISRTARCALQRWPRRCRGVLQVLLR